PPALVFLFTCTLLLPSLSCPSFFSFSSSRHPRALHSFPTRRSSDLPRPVGPRRDRFAGRGLCGHDLRGRRPRRCGSRPDPDRGRGIPQRAVVPAHGRPERPAGGRRSGGGLQHGQYRHPGRGRRPLPHSSPGPPPPERGGCLRRRLLPIDESSDPMTTPPARLQELITLSRLIGEPGRDLVILAEGNTSVRTGGSSMLVKATGSAMADAD